MSTYLRDVTTLSSLLAVGSEEALYLLATCYFRSGKAYKAYRLLKTHTCSTPQCRYLLAKCCVDLSKYEHTHSPQPHSLTPSLSLSLPSAHSESVSHSVTHLLSVYHYKPLWYSLSLKPRPHGNYFLMKMCKSCAYWPTVHMDPAFSRPENTLF